MKADGVSPSGKAAGSGPAIRGFESYHPSQCLLEAFFVGFLFTAKCFDWIFFGSGAGWNDATNESENYA